MSIILFIIILATLVFVHELGHFIIAKKSNIRVDEFGIGFPPKIFAKKFGETIYSLNLIPIGGFVKIFGENPNDLSLEGQDQERSFTRKPRYIQAAVLVGGVLFNLLFAWLLVSISLSAGLPVATSNYEGRGIIRDARVMIGSVEPGSPAAKAGLRAGDVIVSLKSYSDALVEPSPETVHDFVSSHEEILTIEYERGGEKKSVTATPVIILSSEPPRLGISMEEVGVLTLNFPEALIEGAKTTWHLTKAVTIGLGGFFLGAFRGETSIDDLIGPVGIASLVGEAGSLGLVYLLSFTAFISINLAVLNLLPFPALDGGRLLFVAIEGILRRRIKPKILNAANATGFVLLLILMIVVTYHDIVKIIT